MDSQKNNNSHKKNREAQMVGERKKSTRVKEFLDTTDIIRSVLESCGMPYNDANSRTVRRIIELMNKVTNNNKFKSKDEEIFNKVVGITKRIYNDDNLKRLISREHSKKNLTIEEYDILISAFVEEINKDKSLEEQEKIEKLVKSLNGDDLIEEAEKLRDYFNNEYTDAINMLLDINIADVRMKCFYKYKESIYDSMNELKSEIKNIERAHNAIISLLKKEPNILNKEELEKGILSEDLQVKLLVEMDLEEAINEFKEFSKNKS